MNDMTRLDWLALFAACLFLASVPLAVVVFDMTSNYLLALLVLACTMPPAPPLVLRAKNHEPVQELKIIVDLPPNTEVKIAPLLLDSADGALFRYLVKKCEVTVDQEKIMLHYKRPGVIYDPKQNVFTVKGAHYRPTRLKVVYYAP